MYIYDELTNEWVNHRDTAEYQLRKNNVKDMWLIFATTILFLPTALTILVGCFGIFASLTYLDEHKYCEDINY